MCLQQSRNTSQSQAETERKYSNISKSNKDLSSMTARDTRAKNVCQLWLNVITIQKHKSVCWLPDSLISKLSDLLFAPKIKTHRNKKYCSQFVQGQNKMHQFKTTGNIF